MGKKCCKRHPPCKDCPKLKKTQEKGHCHGQPEILANSQIAA
ncbi:MAG: hypothetical protein WBK19_06615 [Azonexus sp.]